MRTRGRTSWRISIDERPVWLIALYARDAAGLRPSTVPVLPPLSPEIRPAVVPGVDTVAASSEWAELWSRLLHDDFPAWFHPPGFGLPEGSALATLLDACWPDAQSWAEARRRHTVALLGDRQHGPVPTDVVKSVGKKLGRPVRDFNLRIDVVPVDGLGPWPLGADHVIVSEGAVANVAAFRAILQPLVSALA